MSCNWHYRCHAFSEHDDQGFVLCEREDGHAGLHRWRDFEWADAEDALAEERELLRRAEQDAGERYE